MSPARWSERQLALLRELGVQQFWPLTPAGGDVAPAVAAPQPPVAVAPIEPVGGPPGAVHAPAPSPVQVTPPAAAPRSPRPTAGAAAARAAPPAVRRPDGLDTMDWPALQQTVATCEACGLCSGRRQTVFGVGHAQAQWMVVGEAPGEQEDRQGEPFVGRAGQLLDRMLAALGLTRSEADASQQVYIANVIKCRPPGNRNPTPEEVAQCEPFLLRQVQLVQPRLILAMGRFAVQSLLRTQEPIGKLRGRVHDYNGVPLIVTYHPAYLLRNPADKALVWDDLCRARELMAERYSSPR